MNSSKIQNLLRLIMKDECLICGAPFKHYPRKNVKAQQNSNTADRYLLSLYRKANARSSRLKPKTE